MAIWRTGVFSSTVICQGGNNAFCMVGWNAVLFLLLLVCALSLGAWCIPWQTPGLRVLENCHSSSTWWITPGLWSWHCDFYLVSRILSGNCSAELNISLSYWQGSQFLIGFVERHLQVYFLTTASFASWLPMVRNWCQNSILQRHCGDWNVIQTLFC